MSIDTKWVFPPARIVLDVKGSIDANTVIMSAQDAVTKADLKIDGETSKL